MSDTKTIKAIALPAITWEVLRLMLDQPGWATTNREIITSCDLQDAIEAALPPKPTPPITPDADRAWSDKVVEIGFAPKEFAVLEKCARATIARGAVGGGKGGRAFVRAFWPEEGAE